jgi:hypothetical protein
MFFSPEHHEKLMQLHELDGGVLEQLHGGEWLEQHQNLFDEHLQMLDEHEAMQFDHDALMQEIEALVEELLEQHLAELEQKSAQSV